MSAGPKRVETIFNGALALPPAERAAFLASGCGDDTELRARVERLLAAHAELEVPPGTASFAPVAGTATFGPGAPEPTADYPVRDERADAVIGGKYALVEPIGEGGMGTVWRAKQTEPVKRFVAVKLIKAGMDSRQVLARFEAERQALAMMDHPNIAKVLDGGLHDGRPFFVMELVKGVPITDYCDALKLPPNARLELFVQACHAIQHAHQKGIIHRDIKPSNVLVARYDDRPVVKVIDFGVAKATGGALTERTIDTGFGGVVGTPHYMSPEQATFNNLDIDTRSDVYALGVLLYELLTGSPPFSRTELEKRGLLEMLRIVREEEPPSTRLSTSDALPSLSANRGTEPKKLTGLLRNELDWIVMMALEKDRARRYETANGFAADVLRYLSGEAVLAHPPSAAYRLRKFVRRNKVQVGAAVSVMLALVAGIAGTGWQAHRAERARADEAEQREQVDVKRGELAEANGTLEKTNGALAKVNTDLGKANTDLGKANGELTTARQKLETALARSLLMPFREKAEPPTGRPEDARDEMAAPEALGVWRVYESADGRMAELFVAEALREPAATRQLGYRAPYLMQAAVGLDPNRRDRLETMLAAELDKPNLSAERVRGVVSALAALDGLSPATAQKAVVAYHPQLVTHGGDGDAVYSTLHRALARDDLPDVTDQFVTRLINGSGMSRGVDALCDLLRRLPRERAVKFYLRTVRQARDKGTRNMMIGRMAEVFGPLDETHPLVVALIQDAGGIEDLEELLLVQLVKVMGQRPAAERDSWARVATERALKRAADAPGNNVISGVAEFCALAPLLRPADAQSGAEKVVLMMRKARAAESQPQDGPNRLIYTHFFAKVLPLLSAQVRTKVLPEEIDFLVGVFDSSAPLVFGFDDTGESGELLMYQLVELSDALGGAERTNLWTRLTEAALRGSETATKALATAPPTDAEKVRQRLAERLWLAVRFSALVDGPTAGDLRRKVWGAAVQSKLANLRPTLPTGSFKTGLETAIARFDPADLIPTLSDRLKDDLPLPELAELAAVAVQVLPRARAELQEQIGERFVARLTKAMAAAPERGFSHLRPRITALNLTRYMAPRAGLEAGRDMLSRAKGATFATLSAWADSLSVIAARMPKEEVPKDCTVWFRVIRKDAATITVPQSLHSLSRGLVALAPFVESTERETACGELAERLLALMEADASATGAYLFTPLSALLPHLPAARRAALLERTEMALTRSLANATDLWVRARAAQGVATFLKQKPVSPTICLEPLARSGGVGARVPYARPNDPTNFHAPELVFRQALTPWTEDEERAKLRQLVLTAGNVSGPGLDRLATGLLAEPFPCKLTDQELVDLLKHPFCVGGARRAVLDQLAVRFRRPFADHWAFVKYVRDRNLPLDLLTPVKRPGG